MMRTLDGNKSRTKDTFLGSLAEVIYKARRRYNIRLSKSRKELELLKPFVRAAIYCNQFNNPYAEEQILALIDKFLSHALKYYNCLNQYNIF